MKSKKKRKPRKPPARPDVLEDIAHDLAEMRAVLQRLLPLQRRAPLGFGSATIAPGERHTFESTPTLGFVAQRLIMPASGPGLLIEGILIAGKQHLIRAGGGGVPAEVFGPSTAFTEHPFEFGTAPPGKQCAIAVRNTSNEPIQVSVGMIGRMETDGERATRLELELERLRARLNGLS